MSVVQIIYLKPLLVKEFNETPKCDWRFILNDQPYIAKLTYKCLSEKSFHCAMHSSTTFMNIFRSKVRVKTFSWNEFYTYLECFPIYHHCKSINVCERLTTYVDVLEIFGLQWAFLAQSISYRNLRTSKAPGDLSVFWSKLAKHFYTSNF